MEQTIDCRGMACPAPLIHTRKALREAALNTQLVILCDNEMALHNVLRYLKELNLSPRYEQDTPNDYKIFVCLDRSVAAAKTTLDRELTCDLPSEPLNKGVVVLKSQYMGSGSEDLGALLMQAYINTLPELDIKPEVIICYNAGIFWSLDDSPVLASLQALELTGTRIIVCGTCLDFYQAKARLSVGQIGNMFQIAECLAQLQPLIYP